ncbi:hypothetical protein [Paraclostridium bifermentans]|uniref:hypothetical protein n=1 Tax=Paraclostridium bifermentans TaxID=1490 RepID=UPI00374EEB72
MEVIVRQLSNSDGELDDYEKDILDDYNLNKYDYEDECIYTIDIDTIEQLVSAQKRLGKLIVDYDFVGTKRLLRLSVYDAYIES